MASRPSDSSLHFSRTSSNFLQAEDPAAASGSGQITTESGSIHSLVWLPTYLSFLRSNNTASTLNGPGQSPIRFGRVPRSETRLELISRTAPTVLCASGCPRQQKTQEMRRRAPALAGRSLRTRSPLLARCALCRTAASKSHTLWPTTMQWLMWQHPKDARLQRRCPVRFWLSLRRLRLR